MQHKAVLTYVALLVVLVKLVNTKEWLEEQGYTAAQELDSKARQQQQQQQESVFWQRRVRQLDPTLLGRSDRNNVPGSVSPAPAVGEFV